MCHILYVCLRDSLPVLRQRHCCCCCCLFSLFRYLLFLSNFIRFFRQFNFCFFSISHFDTVVKYFIIVVRLFITFLLLYPEWPHKQGGCLAAAVARSSPVEVALIDTMHVALKGYCP